MPLPRIVIIALVATLLAASGASADVQTVQDCGRYPAAAVAGIDAEAAEPLACEASFTCPASATDACELFLFGRLWGIGNVELTHTGVDQSCQRRGSQAQCTAGGSIELAPGTSMTWACVAGSGTVAVRIEFECEAAWLNA